MTISEIMKLEEVTNAIKDALKEVTDFYEQMIPQIEARAKIETIEKLEKEQMKVIEWLLGDDTGSSSMTLCRHMLGIKGQRFSYPHDSADRGRCIRLLNLIPEWWDRLDEMAELHSSAVLVIGKNGFESKESGWKEQIPLIKAEALTEKSEGEGQV